MVKIADMVKIAEKHPNPIFFIITKQDNIHRFYTNVVAPKYKSQLGRQVSNYYLNLTTNSCCIQYFSSIFISIRRSDGK